MVTEQQMLLIQRLVSQNETITGILKDMDIAVSTFYYWKNNNKAFQEAMNDAIETRVEEAKKFIRADLYKYINRLNELTNGNNEMASINAIKALFTLAELDSPQELIIKSDESDSKNALLDMMGKSDKEEDSEQNIH